MSPLFGKRSPDEDRQPWYDLGSYYENMFCAEIAPKLDLEAKINPAKRHNPTAPDLIVNGILSELKVRTTPFFLAEEKYGIDPQYCVMFNRKDYDCYRRFYPNLLIYFYIDWQESYRQISGITRCVRRMRGVWRASFKDVCKSTKKGIFGKIDWGNGNDSFALDLTNFYCLFIEFP